MSNSATAYLVYGFDLGGDEEDEGWHFAEVNEDGEPQLDWYDPDDEEESFFEQAVKHLEKMRPKGADCMIDYGGSYTRFRYFLCAKQQFSAGGWDPQSLDLVEMELIRVRGKWDEKLTDVLGVLGITPTASAPSWLLLSYYG